MCSLVLPDKDVCMPDGIHDLDAFLRWTDGSDFPKNVQISYVEDVIWIDTSPGDVNEPAVKAAVASVLTCESINQRIGTFLGGPRLVNRKAGLSHAPDGVFLSHDTLRTRMARIRVVGGNRTEIQGSPTMVLEIVAKSSARRDLQSLLRSYHRAKVSEYWIVDVRDKIRLEIFQHQIEGMVRIPKRAGWVKSKVFGRSFRLSKKTDELGLPQFVLKVKI